MNYRLEDCCIRREATIGDAMRSLESSGVEIVLVLHTDGRVDGVLTDGDIRRALLGGAALGSSVQPFVNRHFSSVGPAEGRAQVLELMQARMLEQMPVITADGKLVGLHLLRELVGCAARPNWAVIMAGGKGTRLRPLTENLPKPMLPVAGRPILERLVLHLVGHGIRRIFLSVNYLSHIIEKHFGDGRFHGCDIQYLRETEPRGSGGALGLLTEAPTTPVLVLNGDLVTQADIGALLDFHVRGSHVATMAVRQYSHRVPFGCVEIANGRITQLEEKPVLLRSINAGIYVLNPDLLTRIPPQGEYPITRLFEESLRNSESVGAYEIDSDWIDVGQREQLKAAQEGAS